MQAVIKKIVRETPDVKSFVFELNEPMNYQTSQFVNIAIPRDKFDKDIPAMPFSIASPPENKREVLVTVRIYPGGRFSPYLAKLGVGDKVDIKGPFGKFVYEKGRSTMIGAGTGIAPLRGMVHCALKDSQDVKVIYSDKTEKDLIYRKEFEDLANKGKIKLKLLVSREENKKYQHGRIDADFLKKNITSTKANFYVCGPPVFVGETIANLKKLGVTEEQIKKEKF